MLKLGRELFFIETMLQHIHTVHYSYIYFGYTTFMDNVWCGLCVYVVKCSLCIRRMNDETKLGKKKRKKNETGNIKLERCYDYLHYYW